MVRRSDGDGALEVSHGDGLPEGVVVPVDDLDAQPLVFLEAREQQPLLVVAHEHAEQPHPHRLAPIALQGADAVQARLPGPVLLLQVAQERLAGPGQFHAVLAPGKQGRTHGPLEPAHAAGEPLARQVEVLCGLGDVARRAERVEVAPLLGAQAKRCHGLPPSGHGGHRAAAGPSGPNIGEVSPSRKRARGLSGPRLQRGVASIWP